MDNYQKILAQLNAFTAKFYTKKLLKGLLLFLAIGLLFFLSILAIEYFLWLNSTGRLLLLILCIGTELFLLVQFILVPLIYLFKMKRGLSHKEASLLIGTHFKEIDDKLYNLLDLAEDSNKSELLRASIEQRSSELTVISFTKAININESFKYIKYLLIPVVLIAGIWFFGDKVSFFGSYKRVVNYDLAYDPPAPFKFHLLTKELDVLDSEPVTIMLTTEGRIKPEHVSLVMDNTEFLLPETDGIFSYVFTPPIQSATFHFSANGLRSGNYSLKVSNTPRIQDFDMVLHYPPHTQRSKQTMLGTGNATIPEGTLVEWKINTLHTTDMLFKTADTLIPFSKEDHLFSLDRKVLKNTVYEISTSNASVRDYEKLGYSLSVIKDAFPTIRVEQVLDTLNPNVSYYKGEATDDYELRSINLIYYPTDEESTIKKLELSQPRQNYDAFYYTFPSGLELQQGKEYSFYFEAVDNDAVNRPKSSKSQVFTTKLLDDGELLDRDIKAKKAILENMDRSLDRFKQQQKSLEELNREQKEKERLSFNDQNKVKDFLKKHGQQDDLMQRFQKELKDNLQRTDKEDKLNKLLQERLERQEMEAKKNEKLLEELKRLTDKIDKEDLTKRLEELGNKQKNRQRNLEQLLELTKRYYLEEKINQLGNKLQDLAKEQKSLAEDSTKNERISNDQKDLNEKFQNISEELGEVKKDNERLNKPMSLEIDQDKQDSIKKDQEDALEELRKSEKQAPTTTSDSEKAKSKQRSAAQKIKEMGEQLKTSAAGSSSSDTAEDAQVLRQVLDNLVVFSFKQEQLYNSLKNVNVTSNLYSGTIKQQQELKELFTHVDDSLFALSLRQAEISELVNEQITEVYYNVDKALDNLAESQFYQGASNQKYVLTATNVLADLLADILENMQQQMQPGGGKGDGKRFQLPDIILGQKELQEKMEQAGQQKSNEGEPGKDGESGNQGENRSGDKNNDDKSGGAGNGGEGNSDQDGPSESELEEIYEIYKEQHQLKQQLESQLKSLIDNDDRNLGEKLAKQMEEFQEQLLQNGITEKTLDQIRTINYELMKLENAAMEQGQKEERKGETGKDNFNNPLMSTPEVFKKTGSDIQILNRQALPLRQSYKNKVKEYFKAND